MQKIIDSLWSKIEESYEAQARVWDQKVVSWQFHVRYHSECVHQQEQEIHNLEHEISELESQQPDPYGEEVQQMSAVEDQTNRRMLAEGESASSEQFRKQHNAERIRQLRIELYSARLYNDVNELDMLECEVEICRSKKKALEIRHKASALISEPTSDIELSERTVLLDSGKCSNYQAIGPSTI
jgi:hypothetical protein